LLVLSVPFFLCSPDTQLSAAVGRSPHLKIENMKTKINMPAILVAATLFALPAICFEYNEATQGDIDNHGNRGSAPLFNLSLGENVIRGTMHVGDSPMDIDAFKFRVPPGTVLDLNSIVYEYEVTSVPFPVNAFGIVLFVGSADGPDQPSYGTGFPDGDTLFLYNDGSISGAAVSPSPANPHFFQIVDGTIDQNFPAAPLEPGIYYMTQGSHWFGCCGDGTWNYKMTLTVTAAP
jgi:hypothetical protein